MTVPRSSARICLIVLARSYQRASEPKWRRGEDWCAAAADSWRSTGVYRQGGSSRAPDHRKNRGHGTESAFAVGKPTIAACSPFMFHRERGTVSNPIQVVTGA